MILILFSDKPAGKCYDVDNAYFKSAMHNNCRICRYAQAFDYSIDYPNLRAINGPAIPTEYTRKTAPAGH
jgi:hypothetical protein